MITHTITGLELTWTLIALVGLLFVLGLLHRAVGDLTFVEEQHVNGPRKYSAITNILIFFGGCITQISYVAVGIVAMTQASPHAHITVANIISSSIFIIASLASTAFAGIIYIRRLKIISMIEALM